MKNYQTLVEALKDNAQKDSGIRFLNNSKDEEYLSYADLLTEASRCLTSYQAFGVKQGDELVLQFKSLRSFVVGYWACLLGGMIPITLSYADNQANTTKVFTVWDILEQPWIATDCDELLNKLESFSTNHEREQTFQAMSSRLFNPDQVDISNIEPKFVEPGPEDIAFIQFSSGSTGQPKGVILTHKNLLVNIYDFAKSYDIGASDSFLSWLPLTHDLGMICFHLAPIVLGVNQNKIPTNTFIWNPTYWFSSVHKFQANILGSPNFGYRHFLKRFKRKVAQSEKWDLNCVKVIINGAEPISTLVCEEFIQELGEWGLVDTAIRPAYGLAEATLVVSTVNKEQGVVPYTVDRSQLSIGQEVNFLEPDHPDSIEVVDCGDAIEHTELRITDQERQPLGENIVGNIEVRGPSITSGYYLNSEATNKVLSADGWLNTQDLGFIHNGRLVFVGREKEMIIIGGVNYFPYDIENVILQNLGMDNLNKYIACGVPNADTGTEDLVVFVYYKKKKLDDFIPIAETVSQLVLNEIGLPVAHVLPVKNIPKTTSGKIQRFKLVQAYQEGEFDTIIEKIESATANDTSEEAPQTLNDKEKKSTSTAVKESKVRTNVESDIDSSKKTGKDSHQELKRATQAQTEKQSKHAPAKQDETLLKTIKSEVEHLLGGSNVDVDTGFFDLGLSSSQLLILQERLEKRTGVNLTSTAVLDYPSIRVLAELLQQERDSDLEQNTENSPQAQGSGDIAIVGMACRFPGGVKSPEEFWQLLDESVDPVRDIPKDRWKNDASARSDLTTHMGGYLDDVDQFDPLFFGITPTEAKSLDPQQRLLLELAWEAFEDAGWNPKSLSGSRTGVFIGIAGSDYLQVGRDLGQPPGPYTFTGNMLNSAAGRISYTFGLQGPCLAIDTACSSSLVSVHQGMLQLRSGNCDVALSGAVNLILRAEAHASFSNLQALAASGRCRSFDESADGYIRSEGSAVLVLKRLEDARRDGDQIWGVIRGAAVNHNGQSGGLTVPNGLAQQRVIQQALTDAGLEPEDIDYVEAHGSGTKIGDPQEANALAAVFNARKRPLYLGSVKSNLGHLETAAGMASLCKVLLSMRNERMPANLHFTKGNPLIPWEKTPLEVVDKSIEWKLRDGVRRAGISSFSISGTNAHMIIEGSPEYMASTTSTETREAHLCTLSARTEESLRQYVRDLEAWCQNPTAGIEELCQNLNTSRASLDHRLAVTVKDIDALKKRLKHLADSSEPLGKRVSDERKPLVFLFTGQGSHYHNMARELYEQSPVFREKLDQLDAAFEPKIGTSIIELVYGDETEDLQRPLYTQPLIFSTQIALAHFWESLGLSPDLIMGHSVGEYAAACIDGIMSLEDAILMVSTRAHVMDRTPATGRMVGLLTNESQAREMIAQYDDVSIAAINAPDNVTVSGGKESIDDLVSRARKSRIFVEELAVSHPFHSVLMRDQAQQFKSEIASIQLNTPTSRFISTVTGETVSNGTVLDAAYWADHLVEPVQFSKALNTAVQSGGQVFVEVGGTATLCGLAAQNVDKEDRLFLPSLRKNQPAWKQIYESLGRLWEAGYNINREALYDGKASRIERLPHTPYHRTSFWFDENSMQQHAFNEVAATSESQSALLEASENVQAETCSIAPTHPETNRVEQSVENRVDSAEIREALRKTIGQVTGVPTEDITDSLHLFSLGLDSLMLVQLGKSIMGQYGVDIPIKTFFAELHTVELLAQYIEEHMPAEYRTTTTTTSIEQKEEVGELDPQHESTTSAPNGVQEIIHRQLAIMEEQLRLMGGTPTAQENVKPPRIQKKAKPSPAKQTRNRAVDNEPSGIELSPHQKEFVERFITRWTSRTKGSKEYAAQHRDVLADWIVSLNFDPSIKEMVYPIVSKNSQGSRFWDIDGNEYVDTAMGYGVSFFGHKPDFVMEAIRQQLDKGFELGPQTPLVGEVTELFKEITGVDRVAYCNTGTEAVMVALRLARSVTGRDKIVRFATSFHGSFDGVLAEADGDTSQPMASGIPQSMVDDTVVLSYGSKESLEMIKRYGSELAAVLVEPVQSRNPGLQPREYLHELRALCSEYGIALIFDEMVTGFRIHTGGAQAYFDVKADIVTYGKLVGGGMPIGIVAGKAQYMNAVDGGTWSYGDDSVPTTQTTFFAGTFCKHPLTMAACRAVLQRLREEGPSLIETTNERTRRFVERANAYFLEAGVPLKTLQFGSMYRFEAGVSSDMSILPLELNLFFRLMMESGVYVWERRTCFFSVEHTDEDADRILDALRYSVEALRKGGFEFRTIDGPTGPGSTPPRHFELSSEERRVYIMSNLQGGNEAYQIRGKLELDGIPDLEKLKKAFEKIADHHEMLRCSIHVEGADVVHLIESKIDPEYLYVDLREEEGQEEFEAFWERPFDLKQAPLWRWALVVDEQGQHNLYISFHHIISDGGSINIILQDLAELYKGNGTPAPTSLSYWDFVEKEKNNLSSPEVKNQREWWMKQLTPLPPALDLPHDAMRPAINEFKGASRYFTIDTDTLSQVRSLAKESKSTTFMVLLAAWTAFLGRVTVQSDFCIGVPWDKRNSGDFNRTVGMFAQTLVLRLRPESSVSFKDFIDSVKDMCLGAYGHADYPLDAMLADLDVSRDLSRNPLFDVMFIYENDEQRVIELGDIHAELGEVPTRHAQFDLTLEMLERGDRLHCSLNYAVPLFSQARVDDWIQRFQHFLENLIVNPDRSLGKFDLLDEKEEQNLLNLGQGQQVNIQGLTVPKVLSQVIQNQSDQPAVWSQGKEITFADLDKRASVLAKRLSDNGLEAGDKVGLLLPRSPDLVATMLAAMKIGCAWVPLDPAFPEERLRYMIENSALKILVSEKEISEQYSFGIPSIEPDDGNSSDEELEQEYESHPDDLAYVVYTSGSSGRPKGVQVEQRSLANFITGMAQTLDWPSGGRTACLTTPSFDIFLLETLLCLSQGGCVVLAEEKEIANPRSIAKLIREGQVDCLQMTPTRLQLMCADQRVADEVLDLVKVLIVGGEAFPTHMLPFLQRHQSLRIFNVYGPTETCVWSTCKELTDSQTVSIGLPIVNTNVYVLDKHMRLVPPGVAGDLWIGGSGVARGYIGNQKLTDERFVEDPFSGGRMYCTGDRAKWNNDELACLGREDDQVKIRGYRIELGEIEAVLRGHPAVANAAAAIRELSPGNHVLVSYYQLLPDKSVTDTEIKTWLADRLPEYMVSAIFVELPDIPQTQNGKIDRKALPAPTMGTTNQTNVESHERLELILIDVWKKILGDRPIGLHDSFFDIGGTSFSLVLMHAELEKIFPGVVTVADLFALPTIARLKEFIETKSSETANEPRGFIPLTAPWFNNSQKKEGQVEVTVESQLASNVRKLGSSYGLELSETMFTLFALYLHKSLEQDNLPLWMIGDGEQVALVDFDFKESTDLGKVFSDFITSRPALQDFVKLRTLGLTVNTDSKARIGFAQDRSFSRQRLLRRMDFYLIVEDRDGTLYLTLEYGKRLAASTLGKHLNRFKKLLEQVVGKLQNSN